MKHWIWLALLVVLSGCTLFNRKPSAGCVRYATLTDEVLEPNDGISMGQQDFHEGEVIEVSAQLVGETPARLQVLRFGGEIVAGPEELRGGTAQLRYQIEQGGTDIFPIINLGPGTVRISVACE